MNDQILKEAAFLKGGQKGALRAFTQKAHRVFSLYSGRSRILKTTVWISMIIFMLLCARIRVFAGQTVLKSEAGIYTVNEGFVLSDEEKAVLDYTVDYFCAHPEAKTLEITNEDFPSLSMDWFNRIVREKCTALTSLYGIPDPGGETETYYDTPIYASHYEKKGSFIRVTITDTAMEGALRIRDWIEQTYSLLPEIGITDGMDELEAVRLINDFTVDFLDYVRGSRNYLELYATGTGSCSVYAAFFKTLCRGAGIDCVSARDYTENHEWNLLNIDSVLYETDTAYNSATGDKRCCLLLTRDEMSAYPNHNYIEKII